MKRENSSSPPPHHHLTAGVQKLDTEAEGWRGGTSEIWGVQFEVLPCMCFDSTGEAGKLARDMCLGFASEANCEVKIYDMLGM